MANPSDEQLMTAVLAGAQPALAVLVERYHGALLAYLYRLTGGDRPLAEDLVQDTFVRLLRPSGYQPGRPVKPWLYAIATNLARDHFKAAAVRYHAGPPTGRDVVDETAGPAELLLAAEQAAEVAAALQELIPEYRATLILRFYQGLSLQEIAMVLDVPVGTVKSRLSTGYRRLRHLLVRGPERVHP